MIITPALSKDLLALIFTALLFLFRIEWIYGDATTSRCISEGDGGSEQCEAEGTPITNPTTTSDNINTNNGNHHHHQSSSTETKINNDDSCRIYLAESSIPNAGLGIYVGVDTPKNTILTNDDVPIIDTDWMAHNDQIDFEWLLDSYYWNGDVVDAEFEAHTTYLALPSFGMVGNCHFGLHDAVMGPRTKDERFHRSVDPGAGAVSDYDRVSWMAERNMTAGEEIFLNYGESYFDRGGVYATVPFEKDWRKAERIVDKFLDLLKTATANQMQNESKESIWQLIKSVASPRTKSALPNDVSSLDDAAKIGLARHSLPNSIRSLQWLKDNGQCMDNLKVMPSTIPRAGRGAFAARFIAKGTLVAPAPLVQIIDRDKLDMYELIRDKKGGEPRRKNDRVVGRQLLLNYCFGHANSSLLLFPYASGVPFINHDGENHNAEIKWSTSKNHRSDWLDLPLENVTVERSGLMFDVVATKDIHPNEEVLIDYGKEWEEAWTTHVEKWTPEPDAETFVYLDDDVERQLALHPLKTVDELKDEPYPINLRTACRYSRVAKDMEITRVDEGKTNVYVPWHDNNNDKPNEMVDHFRPCDVLERYRYEDDPPPLVEYYTARMFNSDDDDNVGEDNIPDDEDHVVYDIPRGAIKFIRKKYSSDMFLRNAFRHHIGVPEGIFPDIWMNREKK